MAAVHEACDPVRSVDRPAAGSRRNPGTAIAYTRKTVSRLTIFLLGVCLSGVCLSALPAAAQTPVVVAGDVSPLGLPYSSFSAPSIDDAGRVVFRAASSGIFRKVGDDLVHALAAGDVLPRGEHVAGIGRPALAADGCVISQAVFVEGGSAVLRTCNGLIEYLADVGDEAPGGGVFTAFLPNVFVSPAGHVAFRARLDDEREGLFRLLGSSVVAIAHTGDISYEGGQIVSLRLIGVSSRGRVGFRAAVSGGRDGLFWSDGTNKGRIATEGEATPSGGSYARIGGATMNGDDAWAFRADRSSDDAGIFRVDASGLVPIIQTVVFENDETETPGVTIRQIPSSLEPSINAGGVVAFRASLRGGNGGSGIFLAPRFGPPVQIVQTQDATAVGGLVRLRDPVIANDESVVVPASITGLGPGLYVYRAGQVTTLAQVGDPTDLDRGAERFRFATPVVTEVAEDALFVGQQLGIFLWNGGDTIPLAYIGGPTPQGGIYASLEAPTAGGPGVVAFVGEIRDGRASKALLSTNGRGEVTTVAATGRREPGKGTMVDFFTGSIDGFEQPDVGRGGRVVFEATIQGSRASRALFMKKGNQITSVAREEQRVDGSPLDAFGRPGTSGAATAFVARFAENGAPVGLFVRRGKKVGMLAREGGRAPGRLDGRFDGFDHPDGGPRSSFVVRATLENGRREGLFMARGKQLGLLIGTGDLAPTGGTFRSFEEAVYGKSAVVFRAQLVGGAEAPSLYRIAAANVPGPNDDATLPALVLASNTPTPVGGTFAAFTQLAANDGGTLVFTADVVGGTTESGIFLMPEGGSIPLPSIAR